MRGNLWEHSDEWPMRRAHAPAWAAPLIRKTAVVKQREANSPPIALAQRPEPHLASCHLLMPDGRWTHLSFGGAIALWCKPPRFQAADTLNERLQCSAHHRLWSLHLAHAPDLLT